MSRRKKHVANFYAINVSYIDTVFQLIGTVNVKCQKHAVKAVLKWPLTEAKFSNAFLKLIFLTKMHENWIYYYWSENASNGIFHFSVQYYRTRVSTDRFSRVPPFLHFYPKIDTNAHLNFVFSVGLTEKRWTQFGFPLQN